MLRTVGNDGSSARPRRPRSLKLCTLVRRSTYTDGVGSVRLSNTLIRPLCSATNTRPSGENCTAVGWLRPLKTTVSWKPDGSVTAIDAEAETRVRRTATTSAPAIGPPFPDRRVAGTKPLATAPQLPPLERLTRVPSYDYASGYVIVKA